MKQIFWLLSGLLIVSTAHSASFNCSGTLSATEQLICSDRRLSMQDVVLASEYKLTLSVSKDKEQLKLSQRSWVKDVRDRCGDAKCLKLSYDERIRALRDSAVSMTVDPLADLEGTYLIQSPSCSVYDGDNGWKSCPPTVVDCLSIKRLSHDTAQVSVESNQTNGHVCSASGKARLSKEGMLKVIDNEVSGTGEATEQVTVDLFFDPMRFEGPADSCGARASWGSVTFARANRRTKEILSCDDYESLEKFLTGKYKK
ncbi:MAG TPA: lysozyme inhibitor LprI family protein [Gallionella sp.]|nr:lysozyme inhibitor LprI family protein [Gallionella sp.]